MNLRSLTFSLALSFFVLSLLVLLISSSLNVFINLRTQQIAVADQEEKVAEKAALITKEYIIDKFSVMQTTVDLGLLMSDNQNEQILILEKLLGGENSFRQIVLYDENSVVKYNISRLSKLVSSQLFDRISTNLFDVTSEGEQYISYVYIDDITSEPMIIIAIPVKDVLGDFKGTLVAEVNLKFMWELVGNMQIGQKGQAYLINKEGTLLAYSDISRVLKGEKLNYLDEANEFIQGDKNSHLSSAKISKGILGNYVVAAHAHLSEPDWAVVVELPAVEAYQPVIDGLLASLYVLLASLFLSVIVGYIFSKNITNPIIKLRDAAIEIGKGNLDNRINIDSKNEIGDLATAFNHMTSDLHDSKEKLESYSRTLEEQVKERTKELQGKNEELNKFNKMAVGREIRMIELKKKIRDLEEQQNKN